MIALVAGGACALGPAAAGSLGGMPAGGLSPADALVFAPHPDDEVIGVGGVLQQAMEKGESVRVAFVTNGDAYPKAASDLTGKPIGELSSLDFLELAATRQREAITAAAALGVSSSSLVFLGYPDGMLGQVIAAKGRGGVRSPLTGKSETYGPVMTDYHTRAHGGPAPYTRAGALADVAEVLRESAPRRVYVTDQADEHPDHRATFDLVRDAITAAGWTGELLTYDVHGGKYWPWPPGPTPQMPLERHVVDGETFPIGISWPPPVRVPLTPHESALKLRALMSHRTQWNIDRAYLESFVKSEEVFWTVHGDRITAP